MKPTKTLTDNNVLLHHKQNVDESDVSYSQESPFLARSPFCRRTKQKSANETTSNKTDAEYTLKTSITKSDQSEKWRITQLTSYTPSCGHI